MNKIHKANSFVIAVLLSVLLADNTFSIPPGVNNSAQYITADTTRQQEGGKGSFFMPSKLSSLALKNAGRSPQAAAMREEIISAAKPWLSYSYDQLWEMMFGSTIKRSWMVWSDGYCPACKKGVPMYNWITSPLEQQWKVQCPHCRERFPKNDFEAFYRSGMDEHYVFNPELADRSLLFNAEHPDKADPMHFFGVDDGEGYIADGHRWRFIGAYLIYGHWKGLIHKGIINLSAAYSVTGDKAYARRAGILLDRVADLYPSHDFGKQGVMYEGPPLAGYVSTWHDACTETREMALAYDMVREAIGKDDSLAIYISGKADSYSLSVSKKTPADIQENIDNGILGDPIRNPGRIYSNYPQTDMTLAIVRTVLNRPGDRDTAMAILDVLIKKATAVDGLTGEKGLTGYTSYATMNIAKVLSEYSRADPDFLEKLIRKNPGLADMFRFHIDVWCNQQYYPHIGDCSGFTIPDTNYVALSFSEKPGMNPSMYSFLWQLYKATDDPVFIQVLYHSNGNKTDGLPFDLFSESPEKMQREVRNIIRRYGETPENHSVNKKGWHLAILKGAGSRQQCSVWLDYDSGGYHSHADGLNIGLFAFGLDLLPDFGYPPVQFGGWASPRAKWYTMTAAHNTVTVNGINQRNLAGTYNERTGFEGQPYGKTTLWNDGKIMKAVRAEAPEVYKLPCYERTVAMANVSEDNSYILDIFRVSGGSDHARMTYSGFSKMKSFGLSTVPAADYGQNTLLRNFNTDSVAQPGWSTDWTIEDRYRQLHDKEEVHLRLTDLTQGASVSLNEAWITNGYNDTTGQWIPAVMTRRHSADTTLESDFISILQPYRVKPFIRSARRIPAAPRVFAVEVIMEDGRHDLWITGGASDRVKNILTGDGKNIAFTGDLAFLRWSSEGSLSFISLAGAKSCSADGWDLNIVPAGGNIELQIKSEVPVLISGERKEILDLSRNGNNIRIR